MRTGGTGSRRAVADLSGYPRCDRSRQRTGRHAPVLGAVAVAVAILGACGHNPGSRESARPVPGDPCAGAATILLSPRLQNRPAPVQAAWVGFALAKRAALRGNGPGVRPSRGDDYASNLVAYRMLLAIWRQRGTEASVRDPNLDTLAEVQRRGYLEEYVLVSYARPGWTVPAAALADMTWKPFLDWAGVHLAGHRPVQLARSCADKPPTAASVPGGDLPDPESLSPARGPCTRDMPGLSAAVARWNRDKARLAGTPLILPTRTSPMPTFHWLFSHVAEYPTGVTFVPPKVATLLFFHGYCSNEARDLPQAERSLREAARLAPFDAGIRLELMQALVGQKKLTQAMAEVDVGLQYAHGKCQLGLAWREKGFILFEQGKLADSYRAYQKSLDYDPGSKVAVSEMLLLAREMSRRPGVPRDFKPYVPPPSKPTTTRCQDE